MKNGLLINLIKIYLKFLCKSPAIPVKCKTRKKEIVNCKNKLDIICPFHLDGLMYIEEYMG